MFRNSSACACGVCVFEREREITMKCEVGKTYKRNCIYRVELHTIKKERQIKAVYISTETKPPTRNE